MQNKFGMDKIPGSHKLEWLYALFPVRIYFTSSKKVTDYLSTMVLQGIALHTFTISTFNYHNAKNYQLYNYVY